MTAPVVEKALRELEKHHALAMLVATQEERARCLRVLASWSAYVQRHGADAATLAVLCKAALEIGAGHDPDHQTMSSAAPNFELTIVPPKGTQ